MDASTTSSSTDRKNGNTLGQQVSTPQGQAEEEHSRDTGAERKTSHMPPVWMSGELQPVSVWNVHKIKLLSKYSSFKPIYTSTAGKKGIYCTDNPLPQLNKNNRTSKPKGQNQACMIQKSPQTKCQPHHCLRGEQENFRPHEQMLHEPLNPLRFSRYAVRGHQIDSCVCDEFQVAATTTHTATNHCHRRRNVASL